MLYKKQMIHYETQHFIFITYFRSFPAYGRL